jgi:hypothetical protein
MLLIFFLGEAYVLRVMDTTRSTYVSSGDPKNEFLMQLDKASENLRLFKADVLDSGTLAAAFAGCEGVFHMASPVPEDKMVDPEVRYTYTTLITIICASSSLHRCKLHRNPRLVASTKINFTSMYIRNNRTNRPSFPYVSLIADFRENINQGLIVSLVSLFSNGPDCQDR